MAKKARVWDGTAFVELASAQNDLTAYSTTAQMNTAITAASGLTLIKTQTIGTTVASVNVTGAFSATYDAYKIVIANTVNSASDTLGMKLGSTATGYAFTTIAAAFSTGSYSNQSASANTTSWLVVGNSGASNVSNTIEIVSPFLTAKTFYNANYINISGGVSGTLSGYLNNTTSYTDFTITPSSGTLTGGTISVYGYKK